MSTILSSAVSSVGKAVRSVANSVRELNTGTFSGAVDVIVVREKTPDGHVYRSTPFHVKFGMLQIMSSSERFVSIEVNGEKVPIRMKLASSGFAYFSPEEDWDDESALSNISADESISMEDVKKRSTRPGMIRSGSFSVLDLRLGGSGGISRCRSYPYFDKGNEDSANLNKPQINVCEPFSTRTTDFYQKVKISACSSILEKGNDGKCLASLSNLKLFEGRKISQAEFKKNPQVLFDDENIALFKGKFFPAKYILAKMFSRSVYGVDLKISEFELEKLDTPSKSINEEKVTVKTQPIEKEQSKNINKPQTKSHEEKQILKKQKKAATIPTPKRSEESRKNPRQKRKHNMHLPSEALALLGLKDGQNVVRFCVRSTLQGTQLIEAAIYLWESTDKLVVTDIDGTITRSDVLGFILPNFWNDWAHHDVAKLFQNVRSNGYRVLYLTARLISLTSMTRKYLFALDQSGGEQLPVGPILTVPFSILMAYRHDQFRRPQDMKIKILQEVQKTFPSKDIFYAGFGNKETDAQTYEQVGIPEPRIFIINPSGAIMKYKVKQTYGSITESVNQIFPPIDESHRHIDMNFGLNYWKPTIREDLDISLDEEDNNSRNL